MTNANGESFSKYQGVDDSEGEEYGAYGDEDEEEDEYEGYRYTVEEQRERLESALLLSQHSIPSVVWGWEAIMFAHSDSGNLCGDLHILVEDHHLESASKLIQHNLPYKLNPETLSTFIGFSQDFELVNCYPLTLRLSRTETLPEEARATPYDILIHPTSFFHFNIHDRTRSMALEYLPDDVRFPIQASWIDSIFDTMRTPYNGEMGDALFRQMTCYLFRLVDATLRERPRVLEGGEFNAECRAALDVLKEENREALKNWLLGYRARDILEVELEYDPTRKPSFGQYRIVSKRPKLPSLRGSPPAS
ncbi:hypothetical protein NMY22_g8990 [Coprinellus aureogranulatus]|nr:hypothetical protein NMY22_g8990 [Coprinellus aureogranulatus]